MEMAGAMLADGGIVRLVMACQGRNKKNRKDTLGEGEAGGDFFFLRLREELCL